MPDSSEGPTLPSSALPEIPPDPGCPQKEPGRLADGAADLKVLLLKGGHVESGLRGGGSAHEGPSQASEPHWRAVMG